MKNFKTYIILIVVALGMQTMTAQEKIDYWEFQKEMAIKKEKEFLKIELSRIEEQLNKSMISIEKAQELSSDAERESNSNIRKRLIDIKTQMYKLYAESEKEIIIKGKDTIFNESKKDKKYLDSLYSSVSKLVKVDQGIENLQKTKERIKKSEKQKLKIELEIINKRLNNKEITFEKAQALKAEAAKIRALNIENNIAIIDNKIDLLERNESIAYLDSNDDSVSFSVKSPLLRIRVHGNENRKYDRRTYSDMVMAVGLNNAIVDGQSLEDSPYKIGGSRFFELGVEWRTRVFKNTNFLRFHYGFSFQFNGLKPVDNQYFVRNNDEPELQDFAVELTKSKFRTDNLVFPLHFEFGPSNKFFNAKENSVRYSTQGHFKFGIGGYGGFNIGARQKLKYKEDGDKRKDKLKGGYNTTSFVYGLSGYVGFGHTQLYVKYDLSPIFKDAVVEQHNISLGLRLNLD